MSQVGGCEIMDAAHADGEDGEGSDEELDWANIDEDIAKHGEVTCYLQHIQGYLYTKASLQ